LGDQEDLIVRAMTNNSRENFHLGSFCGLISKANLQLVGTTIKGGEEQVEEEIRQ
jgi:hypothetical protein